MDPLKFLYSKDILKKALMQSVARVYFEKQEKLDLNRATMIANAVSKSLGG